MLDLFLELNSVLCQVCLLKSQLALRLLCVFYAWESIVLPVGIQTSYKEIENSWNTAVIPKCCRVIFWIFDMKSKSIQYQCFWYWKWLKTNVAEGAFPLVCQAETENKNPIIFNIMHWVAGLMGKSSHEPSFGCSKYHFSHNFLQNSFAKIFSFFCITLTK